MAFETAEAAAFKERVLRYAAQHKAEREQRMAADPNYSDFEPLSCGPCTDAAVARGRKESNRE